MRKTTLRSISTEAEEAQAIASDVHSVNPTIGIRNVERSFGTPYAGTSWRFHMQAFQLIGSLLWQALAIKLAVGWLSEKDNPHLSRCTWNAAIYAAMWFVVLDLVGLMIAGVLPFGGLLALGLKLVGAYVAFGIYFGLTPVRAVAMVPLLHLAAMLWRSVIAPLLPF